MFVPKQWHTAVTANIAYTAAVVQQLTLKDDAERSESNFIDLHAARVSRETRKVLRLAGWDLTEQHTVALDQRMQEVKAAEERMKKADTAVVFFKETLKRTGEVREATQLAEVA